MTTENIKNSEISVVVQGAVSGSKNNNPKHRLTHICLKSVRKYLPGAQIILSTWEGADTENLDYDVLILSKDPGPNQMGDNPTNCFRQIVSSGNGLKACRTKYAIKMRSDLELKGKKFIDYFIKYSQLPFDQNYKILKQRVVTLTTCNPNRRQKWPFNCCDWFFFGLTEDVKNIFDIPLINKQTTRKDQNGDERVAINPYSAEQYIWSQFLSKYKPMHFEHIEDISHDNIALSEKYFASNCILLSSRRAGINWLKFPGVAFAKAPFLNNGGPYTFTEYKKLLNKYANNHLVIVPNIFEELAYAVVYNFRFFIKKQFPKFHAFVVQSIAQKHHRRMQSMNIKTGV